MAKQQPTYQELLAEIYENNPANQYVYDQFYEDEEGIAAFDEEKYETHEVDDQEEFNKFQGNRIKPENVIKVEAAKGGDGKTAYGYDKDIRTTIVNVDGRFRDNTANAPARLTRDQCAGEAAILAKFGGSIGTVFAINLARQYKNVTSVKVISLEFENSFYTFTKLDSDTNTGRDNTTFRFTSFSDDGYSTTYGPVTITIPDGNYVISSTVEGTGLIETIVAATKAALLDASVPDAVSFTLIQVPQTLKLKFGFAHPFKLDFPETTDNFTKNGIGYNLGFYNVIDNASITNSLLGGPNFILNSDTRPDVIQDRYVYIKINDWNQVHHQYPDQSELTAFLKVPLKVPKFGFQNNDVELDTSTKEYFFHQPTNIQKLVISVVDSYGSVLDMQGGSFSMSLGVTEILKTEIYEKMLQL